MFSVFWLPLKCLVAFVTVRMIHLNVTSRGALIFLRKIQCEARTFWCEHQANHCHFNGTDGAWAVFDLRQWCCFGTPLTESLHKFKTTDAVFNCERVVYHQNKWLHIKITQSFNFVCNERHNCKQPLQTNCTECTVELRGAHAVKFFVDNKNPIVQCPLWLNRLRLINSAEDEASCLWRCSLLSQAVPWSVLSFTMNIQIGCSSAANHLFQRNA